MLNSFLLFGVKNRLLVLILVVLGSIAAVTGIQKLVLDTSSKNLIDKNNPNKVIYDKVVEEFGSDNTTIIYIRDKNLWDPAKLSFLEDLHYSLEDLPFVERVDSLFTATSIRDGEGGISSGAVLSEVPEDPAEIAEAKNNAVYNPLILKTFISEDAMVTAINVTVNSDNTDTFNRRAAEAFEKLLTPARKHFEEVFQVGPPKVHWEIRKGFHTDIRFLGGLSLGIMIATIVLFLRNGLAGIIPLLTSCVSILWTFGLMGWLGVPMNLLSAMLPSLIIAIGSTEDTHILATYLQTIATGNNSDSKQKNTIRHQATMVTMKHMGMPIILTTLTTVLGLGSNILSSVDMVIDFGISGIIGMSINGILTILCVPMILSTFGPIKSKVATKDKGISGPQAAILRFFNFLADKHGNRILWIVGGAFIFFLYQASHLYVNNDPISFFKSDHPLIAQAEKMHKDLSGMQIFYINLDGMEKNAFKKPENIERVAKIKAFIQKQGAFDQVMGISDHLSLVNREWNGGKAEDFVVPKSPELVEQYLLFFKRRDLERFVSHDFQRANMIVRHNIKDSHYLKEKLAELDVAINSISEGKLQHHLVGENLLLNDASETLQISQLKSLMLLLLVIFIVMSIVFTSIRGGLISLIPNVLPIVLTFGLMGLWGLSLNPGTIMIAVISIGLAIDDTIHLLTRYNQEARLTMDQSLAVRKTFEAEAIPVIATSVSLMLGFSVFLFSSFSIIAEFGILSALTILFALFADLLVTQIVMKKVRLVGLWEILSLKVDRQVITASCLFDGFSSYQVRKAILLSEMKTYDAGEVIIEQDSESREMSLVLTGSVEVLAREGKNASHLATMHEGAIFGEMAFVQAIKRTAEVRALKPVSLLVFDVERMKQGMRFYPHISAKLNLNIARLIGERFAEQRREQRNELKASVSEVRKPLGNGLNEEQGE